jgi:hypothetical protein
MLGVLGCVARVGGPWSGLRVFGFHQTHAGVNGFSDKERFERWHSLSLDGSLFLRRRIFLSPDLSLFVAVSFSRWFSTVSGAPQWSGSGRRGDGEEDLEAHSAAEEDF